MNWEEIPGWFRWRSAQEDAAHRFPDGRKGVSVVSQLTKVDIKLL